MQRPTASLRPESSFFLQSAADDDDHADDYQHCRAFRDSHPIQPIPVPLIAFEHCSLYIQKHLSQAVAVCGR